MKNATTTLQRNVSIISKSQSKMFISAKNFHPWSVPIEIRKLKDNSINLLRNLKLIYPSSRYVDYLVFKSLKTINFIVVHQSFETLRHLFSSNAVR